MGGDTPFEFSRDCQADSSVGCCGRELFRQEQGLSVRLLKELH